LSSCTWANIPSYVVALGKSPSVAKKKVILLPPVAVTVLEEIVDKVSPFPNTVTATGGNKITFFFATEGDLPNATTYDGMFAHVHDDNTNRVAHSVTWVKLLQETSSIDMLSDVETSSPAPGDGQALVWNNANSRWQAGSIDAGASTFVSLTDTPANFSGASSKFVSINSGATAIEFTSPSINKMSDVDVTTTPPTAGQVLKWNGTNWIPGIDATSGGAGSDADTLDGLLVRLL
jgi:hypothetical protein